MEVCKRGTEKGRDEGKEIEREKDFQRKLSSQKYCRFNLMMKTMLFIILKYPFVFVLRL